MKSLIKRGMLFLFYRILFPLQYNWHKRGKLEEGKAVFIELNQPRLSASLHYLYQEMERRGQYHLHVHCIRQSAGKFRYIRNVCRCLKDMATARYVFMCEGNRFVSCIHPRRETFICQLWHGCGAFKKFGFSTADLIFSGTQEELQRYPYYKNYSCVTVSSPAVAWAYEEAMGLPAASGIVKPLGISRTDVFFREDFRREAKTRLQAACPWIDGRKIILYAPTFRGQTSRAQAPDALEIEKMARALSGEYVLLIKQHPAVRIRPQVPQACRETFAADITEALEIDDLLCVSDICISDYSSLVFEYSLFELPMIFLAYDLEEYGDWRGFYYDYEELTPGPVVRTTEEIIAYIRELDTRFDRQRIVDFKDKFMSACDGKATDRLIEFAGEWRKQNEKK